MNYLQLCQAVQQESGISSGNTITAVTSQSGMNKKIVDWVREAWIDIQSINTLWAWMWNEGTLTTTASTTAYDFADFSSTVLYGVADVARQSVKCHSSIADESFLTFEPWENFRSRFLGVDVTGRPLKFSLKPNGEIAFWPTPDATYTVPFEYYRTPQELAANADTPELPAQFHRAIVYKALMYYAAHDGAADVYQDAGANYVKWMKRITDTQLPQIDIAGAMI